MISAVRTYARARMTALGYVEWKDGFNFADIPKTKLPTAFHVESRPCVGVSDNQDSQVIECPITVRFFTAPTRTPGALIDSAIEDADAVISDFLKASHRATFSGIKNVTLEGADWKPLNNQNDNGVMSELEFRVLVIISTR